jgi:RHS repeat-associated protein
VGNEAGYHLELGRGSSDYAWREVAVLRPAGLDVQSWTGYQCLSGDGRYAAVAVLPTAVVNLATARDRGAFAYSVNLATGAVIPVASGVGLKYFSPGCGTGDTAVFTLNLGSNDEATELVTADLASGKVSEATKVAGQLTSAVPTPEGVVGVVGSTLVSVASSGSTAVLARTDGDGYDLRPSSDGGISFITAAPGTANATARHEHKGRVSALGSGPLTRLQLFQGRAGHAVLTGSTSSDSAAASAVGIRIVNDGKLPNGSVASSLDGDALVGDPSGTQTVPLVMSTRTNTLLKNTQAASTMTPVETPAGYEPPGAVELTPVPRSLGRAQPHGDAAPTKLAPKDASSRELTTSAPMSTTIAQALPTDPNQSPTCAVPPLDETKQVMQPSPNQINWAAQMIEQGKLTGVAYTRPANFDNLGLAAYAPSADFPPIALSHPSSSTSNSVPPSVYAAIMAQESNWDQASWHAPEGTSGDPLISDYYGAAYDIVSINYAGADCGYGIGQVTDGMHVGDTDFSAHGQIKVAVDYQENIAAGLQILESTWNQLYSDGIIANNGDPKDLENWYFAAWAYNSGIQPTGSYNPKGCTPGPSCTGPDGTWGMGWANNPENPDYPPNRDPYLKDTYADAAHPSSWPYQERVLGWMASPLLRDNAPAYSTPTYHGASWLQVPPFSTFCSLTANHCNPAATNTSQTDAGHCMLNDYECWWHQPATWIATCATTCATSAYQYSSGSEPVDTNSNPIACNVDRTKVASNAVIVDDQTSPNLNLMGCTGENWTSNGTFAYKYGTNAAGDPIGAIDTHQLGSGLGGHILFSHTENGSNPALINTGTWTPNLPSLQYYTVKLHIPALGAEATGVVYTINPGGGAAPWKIRVNQAWNSDQWVTIGTFAMQNGGNVVLTNQSSVVGGGNESLVDFDVAYDAIAFVPRGGTPGAPIGGPPTVQDAPKGSNPAWVQCGCAQRTAGDPVNTATGYFGDTWTDLSTPGRGEPLDFTRTYTEATADPAGPNKALAVNGPFGYGWTDSYNLKASTNATSGAVTVTQEDGSQVAFTSSSGVYTPTAPRDDASLTKSGTSYVYTRRGRDIFTFDVSTGHLLTEQDLAGAKAATPYKTTLTYNASGQLSTVTDPDGRVYTLTWTSGHITALKDSAGRTVSYVYDASNDLTGVYGVGSTRSPSLLSNDLTSYSYNTTTHLMTGVRTPANQGGASGAQLSMTYDASERVLTQTDADGRATTFAYGPSSSPSLSAGQALTTDPAGHKTLDTYSNGLLVSETKGYGSTVAATTAYTYDPVTLGISTEVDPAGHTTSYSYDDHGNRLSSSDALGYTTSYAYDSAGDVIETVDPSGVATVNLYDQAGHIKTGTSTTNDGTFGYGDLTSTTVTEANNVVESTTGNFGPAPTRTVNYYYDDPAHPGDRSRSVDPLGHTTTSTYDAAGDLASSTDPDGNKSQQGWDISRGWLTSTVAASGTAAGTTTACTPPANGCTTYAHDLYGNVTATTDPLGHITKATYDADGNKASATDADGNTTTYHHDAADQLTSTTQANGSTLTSTYDGDGALATSKDAAGNTTSYTYDAQGRQSTVTNPDGRVTTTGYDADGNPVTVRNPAGQTTTTGYDADGHPTAMSYSDGTTPKLSAITYDPDGREISMTDGTGTSSWTYDTFSELIQSTSGAGAGLSYGYDDAGDQTSITYPDGAKVGNGYDNAGQLTSLTDAANNKITFGYSPDGLNTTITYPNGTKVSNSFNNADQQTATTLANATTTLGALAYGRDAAGQLTSQTPSGALPGSAQTFAYTALQQVKSAVAGTATSSYGYDGANNITANAGVTQKFDAASQLCWSTGSAVTGTPTCSAAPTGAATYTYDTNGRRTAAAPATGTHSAFTYNQANQMTAATTPSGSGTYAYNGAGLRASKTVGGVTTHYTWGVVAGANALLRDGASDYLYGPGGQVIEQVVGSTASFYVHDQLGSTVALTNGSGAVSGSYAYNTYGKVTAHTGASTALQYGGGYADAETGLVYLQQRYYDPGTGLFLTIDPDLAATGQPYAYVSDDPLNDIDPLGLSWYNPASWSAHDWGNVAKGAGIGAAVVGFAALTVATGGADIALAGVVVEADTAAFALDVTAIGLGGFASVIDCAQDGLISAQCGVDLVGVGLGVVGGWGDFGYAPALWGAGFGALSTMAGITGVDMAVHEGGKSAADGASSARVKGAWNGEAIAC